MMSSKTTSLALICIALMITGCGNTSKPIQKNTSLRTIFVKGNPLNLISGTTSNAISFITPANLKDFNNYSLNGITQFTEKEEVVEQADVGNIEAGQEATEEDSTKDVARMSYKFVQIGNDYIYSSPEKNLELAFELKNGKLDLTSIEIQGVIYDLKSIHYSVKNTGNAFSILVKLNDKDEGEILLSFSFVKNTEQKEIAHTSTSYKYSYGAGVLIPWDQKVTLEIDICGAPSTKIENSYKNGIALWNQALSNRLKISTRTLLNYPPFSDLNTHCIYTINNYLTIAGNDVSNPGTTFTVGDTLQGKLVDSDIMIWVKENEKNGEPLESASSLSQVVGHEVGHLLGLDHQFTDGITSIMSYDGTDFVAVYDREAISKLYPVL